MSSKESLYRPSNAYVDTRLRHCRPQSTSSTSTDKLLYTDQGDRCSSVPYLDGLEMGVRPNWTDYSVTPYFLSLIIVSNISIKQKITALPI